MAIGTAGTNLTTSLTALFHPGSFINPNGLAITGQPAPAGSVAYVQSDADVATINQAIKDDFNPNQPPINATPMLGYSRNGMLYVPNRGFLRIFPGDLVCVDANGWPILISARSIQTGGWTKTAT